jgi:hypothetical protein
MRPHFSTPWVPACAGMTKKWDDPCLVPAPLNPSPRAFDLSPRAFDLSPPAFDPVIPALFDRHPRAGGDPKR